MRGKFAFKKFCNPSPSNFEKKNKVEQDTEEKQSVLSFKKYRYKTQIQKLQNTNWCKYIV